MKLRKALEKAKKERGRETPLVSIKPHRKEIDQAGPEEARVSAPVRPKPKPEVPVAQDERPKGQAGWKPPVYSESRRFKFDRQKAAQNRCVSLFPESEEIEFYKILRTQIQQRTKQQGWNTIMITSTQPGEGKTITSINLAVTMAKEFNQTVLLVDCDLRRQKIHDYLGLENKRGLVDYLIDDKPLNDLITWPNIPHMTLISGGGIIRESTELLGSPKMKALVHEMKARYDDRYVLFDVPPILAGADATAFAPLMDGVVMVVEAARTTKKDVKKALSLIPQEKLIGVVLNKSRGPVKGYYKYY